MTNKRIYFLDLLKFIAIFIVFIYHIVADMYLIHPMFNFSIINCILDRPNTHLAMVACALFVMISGGTIYYSNFIKNNFVLNTNKSFIENVKSIFLFYKKRLTRVLIPFYIAYIIYFAILVYNFKTIHVFAQQPPKINFIFTIFGMDEYIRACGIPTFTIGIGEWFLGCIILCYIAYPFLEFIFNKVKIVSLVLMTVYYFYINENYNFAIAPHLSFYIHIYNFYIGILLMDILAKKNLLSLEQKVLEEKYKKHFIKTIIRCILIAISIFIVFAVLAYNQNLLIKTTYLTTIVVVCICILAHYLESIITTISSYREDLLLPTINRKNVLIIFLEYFSKYSLEIFLVHHFVIYQVDYVLKYRQVNLIETVIIILIEVVAIVILSFIINVLSNAIMNCCHKNTK